MKIGVLTYWTSKDNYGQILQCYALQHFLRKSGYDTCLIRYAPVCKKKWYRKVFIIVKKVIAHGSYKGIKYFFSEERRSAKEIENKELRLTLLNDKLNKRREFEKFRVVYIKEYPILYKSIRELQKNPPKVDALICGSDQIWHNSYADANTAGWFLHFGGKKLKRIAYAASIGHNLSKEDLLKFKKLLEPLNSISVREDRVKQYCENVGYSKVLVVLDPTLLLESSNYEFPDVEGERINTQKPYMFIYVLNVKVKEDIYWSSIQDYLNKENLDVKVVVSSGYCPARDIIPDKKNILATIPEWIKLIRNSSCIITTSFHGMIFSIIMKKQFLVILLNGIYASANDRIVQFLEKVELKNRIYNPSYSIEAQMNATINWSDVDFHIEQMKKESISFLFNSLI